MTNGFKIITLPGRYNSVTIAGWLRHLRGDQYLLLPGHRIIGRVSGVRSINELAIGGPGDDHRLWQPAGPEEVDLHAVRRCIPASAKAWMKACPRPKLMTASADELLRMLEAGELVDQ